jgi:hypothetical protein
MTHPHLSVEQYQAWTNVTGNFSKSPTYIDLVTDMWHAVGWYYAPHMWHGYVFPHSFIDEFTRHYYFPLNEIYYIVYVTLLITLIRYAFEQVICKVCFLR